MICGNCGKEIKDGLMFCPGCGNLIGNENEEPVQTEAVTQPETLDTYSIQPDNGMAAAVTPAESSEQHAGSRQMSDQEMARSVVSGQQNADNKIVDKNNSDNNNSDKNNTDKKSPVPWIIAGIGVAVAVAAIVIVAAVVIVGANAFVHNAKGPDEQARNTAADTGSDTFPDDSADSGIGITGDTGNSGDEDSEIGSGTFPDDSGSGMNTKDDTDVLEKYCRDELIQEYGFFDMDQSIELGYYEAVYDGYRSPAYRSFDDSVEGIMAYKIADFDNDMRSEMLVVRMEHSTVFLEMYEVGDLARVFLSAYMPVAVIGSEVDNAFAFDQICGDVQELNICINENGNEKYIAADCMGAVCLFADGIESVLYISHYDGEAFIRDFQESFCGSDDSGMEDKLKECRSRLRELGFENTAGSFAFLSMQMSDEDGMERIVGLRGENALVYGTYSEANDYYATNDVSCLGTIKYLFAENGKVTHKRFESAYAADYHGINNNSEYILPESDSRYYTMDELAGLTAEECRLARNELFARYGRKFQDEALQTYFDSKSWYHGTVEPEDFDESIFNEYEVANRDLIVQYEKDMGYR